MQIDYDEHYFLKNTIRGQKGPGLGYFTYFSILGSLSQYLRNGESYKLPEVINGDDGISGQSLRRGSGAEHIVGELVRREVRGLSSEPKHLHTCQSVLLAILFQNVLKMLKIGRSHFSVILPSTSLRPVTATQYQISATGFRLVEGRMREMIPTGV